MRYYRFKKGMVGAIGYAVAGGWVDAQQLLDEIGVTSEQIKGTFFCVDEEPTETKSQGVVSYSEFPFWTNCGRRWYNEKIKGFLQPDGTLLVTEEEFEKRCL